MTEFPAHYEPLESGWATVDPGFMRTSRRCYGTFLRDADSIIFWTAEPVEGFHGEFFYYFIPERVTGFERDEGGEAKRKRAKAIASRLARPYADSETRRAVTAAAYDAALLALSGE